MYSDDFVPPPKNLGNLNKNGREVTAQNRMGFSMENIGVDIYEGAHACVMHNSMIEHNELQDVGMGETTPDVFLSKLREQNDDSVIVAYLNINFIYNKFEALKSLVENIIDVLVIAETKIDESFPSSQFLIEGFSTPFRADRNCHGGGLLLYVREGIPCKAVKCEQLGDAEALFIEIIINKTKWLLMGGYNPGKDTISRFLGYVSKAIDANMSIYENFIFMGDFNAASSDCSLYEFCDVYNLQNLIDEPTCYKNPNNPSSIDVILTNRKRSFHNSTAIETGLSDHHKMIITVLNGNLNKKDPIILNYRSYKNFDEDSFREQLANDLLIFDYGDMDYDKFKKAFIDILNLHAPMKKKYIRGNNSPFMNQTLSKAFMHRSKLKNRYNKNPTEVNKISYNQQRNHCVSLLRKEKKKYYNNLDLKIFADNKKFWQRVKPLFSDKQKSLSRDIILVENDKLISDKLEVAEKLNNFFIEAVENLEIESYLPEITRDIPDENIQEIIDQYKNHPSILKIKENVGEGHIFSFKDTTPQDFEREILKLDAKKATPSGDIPTKMIIKTYDIISNHFSEYYNKSKNNYSYPDSLKLADVAPVHKKEERTLAKNYRPVSLIPVVSKLFEKNMYDEIINFIENSLSPYLFGFRKGHSTEQCLVVMLEAWKKALDEKGTAGAILTDLSKAFDCLNHNLLIAKLNAYGFSLDALKFIRSYLKGRKQRTKVGSEFSKWLEIKCGIPQGSILGPLLFNIFLNDIFYFIKDICIANYADDNTPYASDINVTSLLETLEKETSTLLEWFKFNEMKPNEDKCHLFVVNPAEELSVKLGNETIINSTSVDLLGIKIDDKLNFNEHVTKLCKKGNQKLHALARISKYLSKDKIKVIMKTFINSQFNYCPLTWMFHNRTLNNKINRLHERTLRLVYNDENRSFQELLDLDNTTTVHHKNLQKLATEMYKIKNDLSPTPMKAIFNNRIDTHNLRSNGCWQTSRVRTVLYGTETIRYRGPKTWDMLPQNIKDSNTLSEFKAKVKIWKPKNCTCRLCKIFIPELGFID